MTDSQRHLDVVSHDKEGGLALGASSLNAKNWAGSLSYFNNVEQAPSRPIATAQMDEGIVDVGWIPDSSRLAACADSGAVYLWKLSDEKDALTCLSYRCEHDDIVSSLSVNSDGTKLATTSYDRSLKVWDIEQFTPTGHFVAHHDIVWNAAFHPTQPNILVSCSQDGRIILWDLRKPKPASKIDIWLPSLPTCVAWQPHSESTIAVGTETGGIILQDGRAKAMSPATVAVAAHNRLVYRIAFATHRSDWLASVSHDCTTAVTEFTTNSDMYKVIYSDSAHKDFVHGLSWNPVNNRLTTCGWDFKVCSREITSDDAGSCEDGRVEMETNPTISM